MFFAKGKSMPLQNAAFSKSEYDRRIAKTRAAMEAKGIDALWLQTHPIRLG